MEKLDSKPDLQALTIERGIEYPSTEELIMLILGLGNDSTSHRRLAENIMQVLTVTNAKNRYKKLLKVKGLSPAKAMSISAALELGRRTYDIKRNRIVSPVDIIAYVQSYAMKETEHFLCISLNGANEVIQTHLVSVGTVNHTIIHPREIFSQAIRENAAAIILCHNHPSGNTDPSDQDLETTDLLVKCADLVGIPILDHLIIAENSFFSFAQHELLFREKTCDIIKACL